MGLLIEGQLKVGGEVGLLCRVEQVPKFAHNVAIHGPAESNGALLRSDVGGCCVPDAESQQLLLLYHVGLLPNLGVSVEHLALPRSAIMRCCGGTTPRWA